MHGHVEHEPCNAQFPRGRITTRTIDTSRGPGFAGASVLSLSVSSSSCASSRAAQFEIVSVVVSQVGLVGLSTPVSVLVKTTFQVTVLLVPEVILTPGGVVVLAPVFPVLTVAGEAAALSCFVSGPYRTVAVWVEDEHVMVPS